MTDNDRQKKDLLKEEEIKDTKNQYIDENNELTLEDKL